MSGGRLIVLDRAGRDAKQYALTEGLATLGSDLACDIRLMLPAVSPHHATVMVQANQTVVQSVSEGVTLLNDVPVSVAVLRHGDIISMGGRALRWEYSQPQHRPHSKPQPPLVAINKTRNRGKGHRSRSSDPVLHDTPAHNQRASLPASSMKQVAIVQPQRRNVMQGEPSCATELTDSSQIENTENENTQETITRKSARPSQKSLQTITKASEWIESRKSSRAPITPTRTRNNLTPSDLQSRTKSATRPMTQRDTQLRSKSLACIPLETKGEKTKVTLTPRQTQSRSKILDGTQIEIKITRATLTPKETREVLSKSAVTPIDTNAEPKSGTRKSLTPRDALLEPVEVGSKQTKTSIRTTPRQTQSSSKVDVTPLQSRTPAKSTVRAYTPRETRKSRISTLGSATNSVKSRNALILKAARDSRKSSLIPTLSKSRTQAITPTENREPGSNIHTDRRTPLNQSKSLLARSAQSTSTSVLSRSRLTSTPTSSNRQAQFPEKRVLPPRARTLTPRAQEFATNKSLTLRTSRDTSLRLTVLRKSHRPVKIQAPTLIDHTKQAALLLMTRHTKSKSPNAVSTVVVKPSPMSKSLKRNSRGLRESLARKRKSSVLNTSDELSTRRSLSCPSARKSSMKSTLKDPMSGRKTESIKFDLSNLEHGTKSDRLISSVVTVDTTNQTFDSISSNGSPSLRRSIHSRSSRIIEKTLGSPMTVTETTETSIATSPKSRSSRGSLIVQKALEETLKTQNDTSAQTNLTKTLSPRAETYSIVDLVSRDSNATEYNTIDSTPFGTPRSHRETRSFAVALPSSTPYKVPINRSLQYENGNDTPPHTESPEVITPQNDENNKPVASTKVSKRSRSKSRLNDSDLFLLEDEDSPRTSKRADKSATNSLDVSHLKRKLSQSLTESDEESDKSDKNVFAKVPKNSLSNVRIKELFAKSPQNDLRRVSGVKTLFKSLRKQNTPKNTLEDVKGVKRLFKEKEKTPKNTLEDVSGVKGLFRRSPRNDLRVSGVKDALRIKSPKNDLTDVRGVRRLYRLEKERYSSNVSGIEEMFKETSDMDTTFDLLMNKPPLRTYKAASAQKMKQKSKTRLEKSLYDSTSIHVDRWNKNNEIKVYNEKSLPLKKRSIKTLKSTPVKGNVTLNSTELCQISPITKQASVDTAGTSHLDDNTIDISVNNSSVSLGKTTRSTRQNRSALKNSTSTIKQTIVEENPSMSLVIHKKSPIVKSIRKTRQRRMQQQSDSDQNKEIAESKDQKLRETKTKRRTVKTSEPETETISVRRTTRSKATSPRKSSGRRVSIVIKKPTARVTRRGKIPVEEQNDKAKKTKAGPNKNEEHAVEGEARVLTNPTPKIRKRVVIVIPTRTPLASARKTRSRVAAQAKNKATKGIIATPSTTRKGKGKKVEPAENQVTEKPKRKQAEKKNPEVVVEVKTRAKATKKLVATEVEKKTQKGKKVPKAKEIVTPPTGRKKKSPDTTPVENEDIEKPKRGRKKAVKTSVTEVKKQTEVKTRAKANVQAGSSKGDNKTAQPKGKKVASAKEPIAPATSRKRKSPDVTPATKETSVAAKRRKAAELTVPARTTRSKAGSQPKIRGQKR
ncbi:serine/arginine repetitive matrix protein 2 isoform X2 [Pieris rapae]|uniref:serine/arginine repetitive matrix protein 2 isoform X2 n=1 Tax=Pieris rapae TaxID=64459 RepID=UPI001E27B90E|nr:serine/arginine repetitive matrix protein 2 isoform X2 [Pieris rapae]